MEVIWKSPRDRRKPSGFLGTIKEPSMDRRKPTGFLCAEKNILWAEEDLLVYGSMMINTMMINMEQRRPSDLLRMLGDTQVF